MHELLKPGLPSPLLYLRIGRQTLKEAQRDSRQRAETFEHYFGGSTPTAKEQYYNGCLPLIQPTNTSPLAAMLLDGLAKASEENIVFRGTVSARFFTDVPVLSESTVDVTDVLTHHHSSLPYDTPPGVFNGWFVGKLLIPTLTYGVMAPVLLQPHQVELVAPSPDQQAILDES